MAPKGFEFSLGDEKSPPFEITAARQHLQLLDHFCSLLEHVRENAPLSERRATKKASSSQRGVAVQVARRSEENMLNKFLACAESRYVMYLDLLLALQTTGQLKGKAPLPPWDVAMIAHAHLLSPFRYHRDIAERSRYAPLWASGIAFPLRPLHGFIEGKTWTDAQSEKIWEKQYPSSPYQLWNDNLAMGGRLILQDINNFGCPRCQKLVSIALDDWVTMRFNQGEIACPNCRRKWTAERLSGACLRNDIERFITSCDPEKALKGIKGIPVNQLSGKVHARKILVDLSRLELATSPVWDYLQTSSLSFDWAKFEKACHTTQAEAERKGTPVLNQLLLLRIQQAYSTSVWPSISLDLVAAVLRQQSFSNKVIRLSELRQDKALTAASNRYFMFMLLMKPDADGSVKTNVPTLDVDLFWHTHQLFPGFYQRWCETHLGRRVNHDDTIGEKSSKEGFEATKRVWRKAYGHAYSAEECPVVKKEVGQLEYQTDHSKGPGEVSPPKLGTEPSNAVKGSESAPGSFTAQELNEILNQIVSSEETESLVQKLILETLDRRIAKKDKEIRLVGLREAVALCMRPSDADAISDKLTILSLFPSLLEPFKVECEKAIQEFLSKLSDDSDSLTIHDIISSNDRYCVWYFLRKDVIDDLYRTEMDHVAFFNRQKLENPKLRALEDLIEANEECLREALASSERTREENSSLAKELKSQFPRMVTRFVSDFLKPRAIATATELEGRYVQEDAVKEANERERIRQLEREALARREGNEKAAKEQREREEKEEEEKEEEERRQLQSANLEAMEGLMAGTTRLELQADLLDREVSNMRRTIAGIFPRYLFSYPSSLVLTPEMLTPPNALTVQEAQQQAAATRNAQAVLENSLLHQMALSASLANDMPAATLLPTYDTSFPTSGAIAPAIVLEGDVEVGDVEVEDVVVDVEAEDVRYILGVR